MSKQLLVGTWKLMSSENCDADGNIYDIYGKDARLHAYLV